MSQLTKYVKQVVAHMTTSVNITVSQYNFVQKHKLNLSEITRDAIEKLMSETNTGV